MENCLPNSPATVLILHNYQKLKVVERYILITEKQKKEKQLWLSEEQE